MFFSFSFVMSFRAQKSHIFTVCVTFCPTGSVSRRVKSMRILIRNNAYRQICINFNTWKRWILRRKFVVAWARKIFCRELKINSKVSVFLLKQFSSVCMLVVVYCTVTTICMTKMQLMRVEPFFLRYKISKMKLFNQPSLPLNIYLTVESCKVVTWLFQTYIYTFACCTIISVMWVQQLEKCLFMPDFITVRARPFITPSCIRLL